jgi:hypothetical protein
LLSLEDVGNNAFKVNFLDVVRNDVSTAMISLMRQAESSIDYALLSSVCKTLGGDAEHGTSKEVSDAVEHISKFWDHVSNSAKCKFNINKEIKVEISISENSEILSPSSNVKNIMNISKQDYLGDSYVLSFKIVIEDSERNPEVDFMQAVFVSFCHTNVSGMGIEHVIDMKQSSISAFAKKKLEILEEHGFENEIYANLGACVFYMIGAMRHEEEIDLAFLRELYHGIDLLSTQLYEGSTAKGVVYFVEDHPDTIYNQIDLSSPISLRERKGARKLLETSHGKFGLLLNSSGNIIGLGEMEKKICSWVRISKQSWEFGSFSETPTMIVNRGFIQPFPKQGCNFDTRLSDLFKNLPQLDLLINIIELAKSQSHGTMVVICSDAEAEAKRLRNHSTLVNLKLEMNDTRVVPLTSVDGALLIDLNGVCHAFGVILDGVEDCKRVNRGNSNRGARYNAAFKYVDTRYEREQILAVAVVISEDGFVDFVAPDLKVETSAEHAVLKLSTLGSNIHD